MLVLKFVVISGVDEGAREASGNMLIYRSKLFCGAQVQPLLLLLPSIVYSCFFINC